VKHEGVPLGSRQLAHVERRRRDAEVSLRFERDATGSKLQAERWRSAGTRRHRNHCECKRRITG